MISKRQRLILWSNFVALVCLSILGVYFGLATRRLVPMALNDSSPNFGQLAHEDRWAVYHEAQNWITMVTVVTLALVVLWAALSGFSIWRLTRNTDHEPHRT